MSDAANMEPLRSRSPLASPDPLPSPDPPLFRSSPDPSLSPDLRLRSPAPFRLPHQDGACTPGYASDVELCSRLGESAPSARPSPVLNSSIRRSNRYCSSKLGFWRLRKSARGSWLRPGNQEDGSKSTEPARSGWSSWWKKLRPRNWWWTSEIVASLVGVACIGVLGWFLMSIHNTPLAAWKHDLNPNSVVALIVTLAKASIMVPASTCISQMKWRFFMDRRRRLQFLTLYDEASRGPWGSLNLLFSHAFLSASFITLGFITVMLLAVAIDTAAQQVLNFPMRDTLIEDLNITTGYATNYSTNYNFSRPEFHWYSYLQGVETPDSMIRSAVSALLNGGTEPSFICPPPATHCQWPDIRTVAYCVDFENVTASIERNCTLPEDPICVASSSGSTAVPEVFSRPDSYDPGKNGRLGDPYSNSTYAWGEPTNGWNLSCNPDYMGLLSWLNCTYSHKSSDPARLFPPFETSFFFRGLFSPVGEIERIPGFFSDFDSEFEPVARNETAYQAYLLVGRARRNGSAKFRLRPDGGVQLVDSDMDFFKAKFGYCVRTYKGVKVNRNGLSINESSHEYLRAGPGVGYKDISYNYPTKEMISYNDMAGNKYFIPEMTLYKVDYVMSIVLKMLPKNFTVFSRGNSPVEMFLGDYDPVIPALFREDFNQTLQSIATAITNQMRFNESGDNLEAAAVAGRGYLSETYIVVEWGWATLPAVEVALTVVLVACAVWHNRRVPLLKDSMVAPMLLGMEGWSDGERSELLAAASPLSSDSVDRVARETFVQLEEDKDGLLRFRRK